jgi:hypothetical protein
MERLKDKKIVETVEINGFKIVKMEQTIVDDGTIFTKEHLKVQIKEPSERKAVGTFIEVKDFFGSELRQVKMNFDTTKELASKHPQDLANLLFD